MTQVQTNVALSATTREDYNRQVRNDVTTKALNDYERDLAEARHWTMRALTKDGDDKAVDLTWAGLVADVAHSEVVKRLHAVGVFQ